MQVICPGVMYSNMMGLSSPDAFFNFSKKLIGLKTLENSIMNEIAFSNQFLQAFSFFS